QFLRPFDRESQNGALRRRITGGTALSGQGNFGTNVHNTSCGSHEKRKSRLRDRIIVDEIPFERRSKPFRTAVLQPDTVVDSRLVYNAIDPTQFVADRFDSGPNIG